MADLKLAKGTKATVINDDATLADTVRAAGDYDNSSNLMLEAVAYLTAQYDGSAPSAGDLIAELWVLPGDGEGAETFPEGGDAAIGTDDDPQGIYHVASLVAVNPSLTVDEVLGTLVFDLYPGGNRFVLKNTSGQTFDATWQLDIVPYYRTVA